MFQPSEMCTVDQKKNEIKKCDSKHKNVGYRKMTSQQNNLNK